MSCNAASLEVAELKIAGCNVDEEEDNGFDGFEVVDGCESIRA